MGPTEILRRRADGSAIFVGGRDNGFGDLALSTALLRELAVVAIETGCRGRELRSGGDNLGGGAMILACSRLLLLLGVTRARGAPFRLVGVFADDLV